MLKVRSSPKISISLKDNFTALMRRCYRLICKRSYNLRAHQRLSWHNICGRRGGATMSLWLGLLYRHHFFLHFIQSLNYSFRISALYNKIPLFTGQVPSSWKRQCCIQQISNDRQQHQFVRKNLNRIEINSLYAIQIMIVLAKHFFSDTST